MHKRSLMPRLAIGSIGVLACAGLACAASAVASAAGDDWPAQGALLCGAAAAAIVMAWRLAQRRRPAEPEQ